MMQSMLHQTQKTEMLLPMIANITMLRKNRASYQSQKKNIKFVILKISKTHKLTCILLFDARLIQLICHPPRIPLATVSRRVSSLD